jgi:hypothetical protein
MGIIYRSYAWNLAKALRNTIIVTRFQLKPGADLQEKGLRMLAAGQERGYDFYVSGRALSASGFKDLATQFNKAILAIGEDLTNLKDVFKDAEQEERSLSNTIQEKADFFGEMAAWLDAFGFLAQQNGNIGLRGKLDNLSAKSKKFSLVFNEVADSDLVKWIDDIK